MIVNGARSYLCIGCGRVGVKGRVFGGLAVGVGGEGKEGWRFGDGF